MFLKYPRCVKYPGSYLLPALIALFFSPVGMALAGNVSFISGAAESRIANQVQQLDNQIGNLLLKIPVGTNNATSPAEVQETYRLIIRHLYESATHCKNVPLRSLMVLKADQLFAGLSDFDKQINILLSAANANNAAIAQACRNFYRASSQVNAPLVSAEALHKYLHRLLKPLAPLAQREFTSTSALIVWPLTEGSQSHWKSDKPAAGLPDIDAEIATLQHARIPARMRDIMGSILQQLKQGVKTPASRPQSLEYYGIILQCVSLAEHLQQGAVLSKTLRSHFNHRLMLGLLFFKDPRTRDVGARELESIEVVVRSLELLQTAPLPSKAQRVVSQCVQKTIEQMQTSHDAMQYAQNLQALDQLLIQQRIFAQLLQRDHASYTDTAWRRIAEDGRKDLRQTITALKTDFNRRAVQTYVAHVAELTQNLGRLIAMRFSAEQALLYHPRGADGVAQNMRRWATHIGMHPYQNGAAVRSFKRFNHVLLLLAAVHRAMAAQGPEKILARISGGRYQRFVTQFLKTQRDIVDSLAQRQLASDALLHRLGRQRLIFKTSSELAYLLEADQPLLRLNQWAAWHISQGTEKTLLNQFEQTLSFEFHSATSNKPMSSEAWAGFTVTAGPIATLAETCQTLLPQLNVSTAAWSTGWLQTYSWQPPNALCGSEAPAFTMACMFFNDAHYQNAHGRSQRAMALFNSGLQAIK